MLNNDPRVRQIIYWVTIVVSITAIGLEAVPTLWAEQAGGAFEKIAIYLGTLTSVTAATNLTNGGDVRLLEEKKTVTSTTTVK